MPDSAAAIAHVRRAFAATPHPGDPFLLGSVEGSEPFEVVEPFRGRHDWTALDAGFLDPLATALSFLSEGGFRFYLPAFLVADLQGRLEVADPFFHLTHGFHATEVAHDVDGRQFLRRSGADHLLNPRRYGAMTWRDHARLRLAVFTREEAAAIVDYLEVRADRAATTFERGLARSALDGFWRERARSAPTADDLAHHLAEEAAYVAALRRRSAGG